MQINIKVFCKLIPSFLVCATRHAQSTYNKFAYCCNISRKAWGDFWYANEHKSFLLADSITCSVVTCLVRCYLLNDFSMCLCILFIGLKMLNSFLSGLMLIKLQPSFFSVALFLCIS